jgi:cytochrome c oxidase cbb3-type subunit 1
MNFKNKMKMNQSESIESFNPGSESPLYLDDSITYPAPRRLTPKNQLVIAFILTSAFWLVFGTLAGVLVSLKFIWPDFLESSWLTFGRLRPIHTNTVFWGWSSLAILALGYHVVPVVSNTRIFSLRIGWISFVLVNLTVLFGNIALFYGVNNGMQEYREYIWPIQGLFIVAVILSTINFYITIARRKVREIYISSWFIMGSCFWTITFFIISYLPFYQQGLGETAIQGYYMHQAVGMWFMTFVLGLVYFYIPRMVNDAIYSHKLGMLAFWTQMIFYAMIGTHHFIFSPIPWWMQTSAIIFSVGMFVPVVASTANWTLTLWGHGKAIRRSPALYFMLTGVAYYFIGSMQGSVEALRHFNMMWHFTDFTIAHSHITMYGIISSFVWAMIYAMAPLLSQTKPNRRLIIWHFWLAFVGLLIYTIPLMIGGTLRGQSWMANEPFLHSVTLMMPYWIWRAIGGLMMFSAHLLFAWIIFRMYKLNFKKAKL